MTIKTQDQRHVAQPASGQVVDFLIVGAGAAGVYASYLLRQLLPQSTIIVLEKSRGVGGRLATRRLQFGDGSVDGAVDALAQSAIDDHRVEIDLGALVINHPYRSTLLQRPEALDIQLTSWNGLDVFAGLSNGALKRIQTHSHSVEYHYQSRACVLAYHQAQKLWLVDCIAAQPYQVQAKQVILTMPAPQVHDILSQTDQDQLGAFPVDLVAGVQMVCRWTWVIVTSGQPTAQSLYRPIAHECIETIFVVGQKPGITPPSDVNLFHVSMTLAWSEQFEMSDKQTIAKAWNDTIIKALIDIVGLEHSAKCLAVHNHKWRYAQPSSPLHCGYLSNVRQDLWCIGDWLAGYGVDDSFYAAEQMVAALAKNM